MSPRHASRLRCARHLALLMTIACAWFARGARAQDRFPQYEASPPSEELPDEELPPDEAAAVSQDETPSPQDTAGQDVVEEDGAADAAAAAQQAAAPDEALASETAAPGAGQAAPEADQKLSVRIAAGAGAGTLEMLRPVAEGSQKLPRSAFAAAELQLRVHAWPRDRLSFDFSLVYATTLGMRLQVEPLFGLSQTVPVRSQRAELSAAAMLRLGAAQDALSLAFPVGVVLRSFVPEQHQYGVLRHLLIGLDLRAELLAPLGASARLRIGPEVQWIASVDASLRNQGACCAGVSIGGQGSLEADVSETFSIALVYREAHSFVPANEARFKDIERWLTARIGVQL